MTTTAYRAAIVVLLLAVATLAVLLATRHDAAATPKTVTVVRTADDVTSYNDGWADSKADDCQQGFAAACAWMHSN